MTFHFPFSEGRTWSSTDRPGPFFSNDMPRPPSYTDDYESQSWIDLEEFRQYALRLAEIIKAADKSKDPNYRGITVGEIHRQMGDTVNRAYTAAALDLLGLQASERVPTEYTFRLPPVKYVQKERWGKVEVPVTSLPKLNPRAFPAEAMCGRRQGR